MSDRTVPGRGRRRARRAEARRTTGLDHLDVPLVADGARHRRHDDATGRAVVAEAQATIADLPGVDSAPAGGVPAGYTRTTRRPPLAATTAVTEGALDTVGVKARRGNATSTAPQAGPAVLYIEDHPVNVELMHGVFIALWPHFHLATVRTATAGLEHIRAERPDLVLLDGNVVDLDGRDLLRHIRSDPATTTMPIIVVSSDARPSRVVELLALGATDYLLKPLHFGHLGHLVTNLTTSQRARDATAPPRP